MVNNSIRNLAGLSLCMALLGVFAACDSASLGNALDSIDELEGGDKHSPVGTNPFVDARHDPRSTFAVDVDTASYDLFVRDVNDGRQPAAYGVRVEEYINFFAYDYPAPKEDAAHPFRISLDAGPSLAHDNTFMLRVGIQAEQPQPIEKKPTALTFLVDTSGSMTSEDKLPLVKHFIRSALKQLDPKDTVAIVTYAGRSGVQLRPTPASDTDRIEREIDKFSAGGSTAGAAGIDDAYKQAQAGFRENGFNQVILLTDGDFNVGQSSDEALVELITEKRASGVTLSVLGFGYGNLNDSMMEKVSNAGDGFYAVLSSERQAERYAEEKLLANVNIVARDMKVQVEFNPEQVYAYRLLGYENRAIDDDSFDDDRVDGGEVGAGHRVTALYELALNASDLPKLPDGPELETGSASTDESAVSPEDLVSVAVRYRPADSQTDEAAKETRESLPANIFEDAKHKADGDLQWASAIVAFAEILKDSPYANPEVLDDIEAITSELAGSDQDRREFVDLFARWRKIADETSQD